MIGSVRSAIGFLTVLPAAVEWSEQRRLGRAYFPIVGAAIGLVAGGVFGGMAAISTPLVAAVGAVATLAVLTGGLHLDGLADAADGLLGGADRERRLEIMRDSRVGSFGVIALVLVLVGEVAALAGMAPWRALVALVIAGALSRWAMVGLIAHLPYVRPSGLGVAATGGNRLTDLALATVPAALVLALNWRAGLVAAPSVLITAGAVGLFARARIGGATGDVYGASCELAQLAALVTLTLHV